jgi:hypothetical protein
MFLLRENNVRKRIEAAETGFCEERIFRASSGV